MLWLWVIATALGGGFYLESPHVEAREEAVRIEGVLREAGHEGHIVRRFVDGEGWRFLVRIEGFGRQGPAQSTAQSLSDTLDMAFDVLYTDGRKARLVLRQEPGEAAEGSGDVGSDPELEVAAVAVLERAVAAHGVDRDTLTRWMEGPTHFEYRRSLGDSTVVDHRWYTRDGATYVMVNAVKGHASSSRVFVSPGHAWLSVGEGEWQPQSAERARVVARDLGPAGVIPIVLGLRQAMETRPELAQLQYAGEGAVSGEPVHVLGFGGDLGMPALVLEISMGSALIRRVSFSGGEVVHQFSDFRPVGALVLPFRVVSTRAGGVADVVEVAVLRTGDDVLDDAFVVASNATSPPP